MTIAGMDANSSRTANMRNLVAESGGPAEWARKFGGSRWSQAQVSQWISETNPKGIGRKLARDLEKAMQLPDAVLDRPPPDMRISSFSEIENNRGYLRFPLLDGFVAAGEGGYVPDYPEVVQFVEVAEEWARRNIHVPHESVRVITARGDSMIGDLNDGDVLFVDCRIQGFDTDSVYVINWQGRPLVKRLQARMDGSVAIRSTNPAYETEIVPRDEIDQLFISGRVIAAWVFKKF